MIARRRLTLTAALAAMLVAGLLQAPLAPAAERAPKYDIKVTEHIVPTKFGKIYLRVAHPVDAKGKIVKSPAIFTYSPYWVLGVGTEFRRASGSSTWVPKGYTRVWGDVVGTGNSGGCYDYGGQREKVTAAAMVEWIAKQKWSTGKVAMMGSSYEGTTATAAAVMDPKGLTTIVPEAAISRWYGYAYSGGIRYFLNNENPGDEGFDTPFAFDFGLQVPPPIDAQNPDWAERFGDNVSPCDEIEHTQHGYDDTPDYDKFWLERDYTKDAGKIDIPVLVAHNWGDWNVKQEEAWNLFHALRNSPKKVLYMGDRYMGHGTPDGGYEKFREAWLAHYLKGVNNGIQNSPAYISQTSDYYGDMKYLTANKVRTKNVQLYAQEGIRSGTQDAQWKLMPSRPLVGMMPTEARFTSANINTEAHSLHHARENHDWFWFESPPLKHDVRMFGRAKIKIAVQTDREWITLTPTIADVDMNCHRYVGNQHVSDPTCAPRDLISVTRGWLDSRYRNGLAKQQLMKPNQPVGMTIVEHPQDYTFRRGHVIGLLVATEINEWSLPKPYPCASTECARPRIMWEKGETRVILPLVNPPKVSDMFDMGHHH